MQFANKSNIQIDNNLTFSAYSDTETIYSALYLSSSDIENRSGKAEGPLINFTLKENRKQKCLIMKKKNSYRIK